MTTVYKENGALMVARVGQDLVYLNLANTRLIQSEEALLVHDGQTNRTVDLGLYSEIKKFNGDTFATFADCYSYLSLLLETSISVSSSESLDDPYAYKVIDMNSAETYTTIKFYDAGDSLLKTQIIVEGLAPSEVIDPTKRITITNS